MSRPSSQLLLLPRRVASAVALGAASFVAATLGVLVVTGLWRGAGATDAIVLLAPAAAALTGGVLAAW